MSFLKRLHISASFTFFATVLSLSAMEMENKEIFLLDSLSAEIKQEIVKALVENETIENSQANIGNLRLVNRCWRALIDDPFIFKQIIIDMAHSKKNKSFKSTSIVRKWQKMPATKEASFKEWLEAEEARIKLIQQFHHAARCSDIEQLNNLLPCIKSTGGIDVTNSLGTSAFSTAVECNAIESLKWLLTKGADYDKPNKYKLTPLASSIAQERIHMVRFLLENNANPNKVGNHYNQTPLVCAIINNDAAIANLLIIGGADINRQDTYGDTPLMVAVEQAFPNMVKTLIEAEANTHLKNSSGETAWDIASQKFKGNYFPEIPTYLLNIILNECAQGTTSYIAYLPTELRQELAKYHL